MTTCALALKEWAVIVDALARGDQLLLLRKGGLADSGGEFTVAAERFCLWPTYLHQDTDWLAEPYHDRLAPILAARPTGRTYRLDTFATLAETLQVPSRKALDRLAGEHLWSVDYLDLRWRYRPELPLHLLLLRTWRLAEPVLVEETVAQSGCRSWVALDPPVELGQLTPVVPAAEWGHRAEIIRAACATPANPV